MAPKREPVHFDDEIFLFGDDYYFRGTPSGLKKQVERSLGLKRGVSQKVIAEAKSDLLKSLELEGPTKGDKQLKRLAEKYISDRHKEALNPEYLSKRTADETEHVMRSYLIPMLGSKKVTEIGQKEFKEYCESKKIKGLNVVNHRKVLSHFLKWCVHEKHLRFRVEIEIPKSSRKKRRERVVLTEDQIKALVSACDDKVLLYVLMYLFMGMRNMEICKLRWDEVNLELGELFVNPMSNRRRKARSIPINGYVLTLLNEWKKTAKSEWVFPSAVSGGKFGHMNPYGGIRAPWTKALATAGITGVTPHDMRSTFETFMHTNAAFTDTQKEKMAGAKIDVQKDIYVKMQARQLRGLEESVTVEGIGKILDSKVTIRGKVRGKRANRGR